MKLTELTWPQVNGLDRETVVIIPTGSVEQHGPHLPLGTDSILATAVAEAVEAKLPDKVLLTPTVWLGASAHHLGFAGSLTASYSGYFEAIAGIVDSLSKHEFRRYFLLNGHGGNTSPNDVAARELKARYPNSEFCASNYWSGIDELVRNTLQGPLKTIRHACEGETSLMLHVRPDLVRFELAATDGLAAEDGPRGAIRFFDEITENGNFGYSGLGSAAKGKLIFDAAVADMTSEVRKFGQSSVLLGLEDRSV